LERFGYRAKPLATALALPPLALSLQSRSPLASHCYQGQKRGIDMGHQSERVSLVQALVSPDLFLVAKIQV
ncbi:hypothetical protein D046_1648, partial [Vibrio parahaemolyticus V-223/04]